MSPDRGIARHLDDARRALVGAACWRGAAAGAVLGAVLALALRQAGRGGLAALAALGACVAVFVTWQWVGATRRWRDAAVAEALERRFPSLHNLVVTAVQLTGAPHASSLQTAVCDAAVARLAAVEPDAARAFSAPSRDKVIAAFALVAGAIIASLPGGTAIAPASRGPGAAADGAARRPAAVIAVRVTVSGPAYIAQPPRTLEDPEAIQVVAGSSLRAVVEAPAATAVQLLDGTQDERPLSRAAGGFAIEVQPERSGTWFLVPIGAGGARGANRPLRVDVRPDRPPDVRISLPGRDERRPFPEGVIPVRSEAADDLALAGLALRVTKVTGGGENFAFEERELPLAISRASDTAWSGTGALDLGAFALEPGDMLIYRAVARDRRPGAPPALSSSFVVEIGRRTEAAAGGFAIDPEEQRQGLSQQMVIAKTERLHAARATLAPEAWQAQARDLGVEQRMVRAEFVFLTGGEVEDEVEEAARGHELVEGRQENASQVELFAAIRAMARAEARLETGDTGEALRFEREALAALQRAFDRRRYLLRATPERARLDPARRLSGALGGSADWQRTAPPGPDLEAASALRGVLALLSATRQAGGNLLPTATAVAEIDRDDADLQAAAAALGGATSRAASDAAADRAIGLVGARLERALGPAALPVAPTLSGDVAARLRAREGRR